MAQLNKTIVTTSWDDGDRADMKLAALFRNYGMPATFYVPIRPYLGRPSISCGEWRELSREGFEIGAHGVDHEHMPSLSREKTLAVVRECKNRLEAALSKPVRMFCYPGGRYTPTTMRCLADAGYEGARTTRMLATRLSFDRFEMPTTVQAFPHPPLTYLKNTLKARRPARMYNYMIGGRRSWVELGKRLFDRVHREGGIWHLYGHSWEIEEHGMWNDLKDLLDYVGGRERVAYLTNGDALERLHPATLAFRQRERVGEDSSSSQHVSTAGR
ncbi:MAG TPA: polysaccharide deacetylase family protein [Terriglobales bacterium]|nr:polysaccharide deacetylase family protein [Terriglobales bacterium]